jgi:poly-gamma-glutamate synthesis protein (capsule biosynthesis protein)
MKVRNAIVGALAIGGLLAQGAAFSAAAPKAFESAAGKPDEMVIATTGDTIIMRRLQTISRPDADKLWGLLRGADAAFTNFETQVTDFTFPGAEQSGGTYMSSPFWVVDELKWAGFDMVSIANNHGGDFGQDGIRNTMKVLTEKELPYAGAGENLALARAPAYVDTRRGRVALIAVTTSFPPASMAGAQRKDMRGRPGVNPLRNIRTNTVPQATFDSLKKLAGAAESATSISYGGATFVVGSEVGTSTKADPNDLKEIVAAIKDAKYQADFVVVSMHHHETEAGDRDQPAKFAMEFTHAAVDAGADIVTGHGHHMLRGMEIYKGKPILYSLGDFVFENDLVSFQPADNFTKEKLNNDHLPGDYYNSRTDFEKKSFPADRRYWQSVVAEAVFNRADNKLKAVRLHPVSLNWYDSKRSTRGQPAPAPKKEADEIFEDIKRNSAPFGTKFEYANGVISIVLE